MLNINFLILLIFYRLDADAAIYYDGGKGGSSIPSISYSDIVGLPTSANKGFLILFPSYWVFDKETGSIAIFPIYWVLDKGTGSILFPIYWVCDKGTGSNASTSPIIS